MVWKVGNLLHRISDILRKRKVRKGLSEILSLKDKPGVIQEMKKEILASYKIGFGVFLLSFLFSCNEAKMISLDASNAGGILLAVLPDLLSGGEEPIPEGFPTLSTGTIYDAGNTDITLNFSEPFTSDEIFTMAIESYTTVNPPSFVGYNTFTVYVSETSKMIGFALNADDNDCLDRVGDAFSVRVTRNSTQENHLYTFTVLDGDYCVFGSQAKKATELGGLLAMDNHCKQQAISKNLPRNPAHYKAMVAGISSSYGNRNLGSSSTFFQIGKRYVRQNTNGSWVKVFQNSSGWPPTVDFDNPFLESGYYWTGMNSGWGTQVLDSCPNDAGTESWMPETTASSGNLGAATTTYNDAAQVTIDGCSSNPYRFVCVYSP